MSSANGWPAKCSRSRQSPECSVRPHAEDRANLARHRIAAWLRMLLKPKGRVWAARGDRWALGAHSRQEDQVVSL